MLSTGKLFFFVLSMCAFLTGATLQACSTSQRIDALVVAAEIQTLADAWDSTDRLIAQNLDRLEPADRELMAQSWQQLTGMREYISAQGTQRLLSNPPEVQRLYWQARAAYSDLRRASMPYLDDLNWSDQMLVRQVDTSARSLDAAAGALMASADDADQALVEIIRMATLTARLAAVVLR